MDVFYGIFAVVIMLLFLYDDYIKDIFYTLVGQRNKKALKPKDAKALREEADLAKHELAQANEILRSVQAADTVMPQLPQPVRDRVDEHLDGYQPVVHQLPNRKRK